MMDRDLILRKAEEYVKELFSNDYSGHDHYHTLRVARMARAIAKEEHADEFIVALASLLHDVDDAKLSPETSEHLSNANGFMIENEVPESTRKLVCSIIREVSFKGKGSVKPTSLEGMCVQDADRLDALGAIGIARTFAYGGSRGRALFDPNALPRLDMSESEYRNSNSSSINHFYEKLFLLKDMMNTASAKREAEARDSFMHDFVDRFMQEWNCGI